MARLTAVESEEKASDVLESMNPATGEVLGTFPNMDPGTIASVVAHARANQNEWGATSPERRGAHLIEVRRSLARSARGIADICAQETGKSPQDAYFELMAACGMITWAGKNVARALRSQALSSYPVVSKRVWVRYEPVGVVGVISPWNYPIGIPMQVLPYALGAGNTVAFKPSELATLTGLALAEAVNDAGLELIHVVTGGGAAGEALVRAPVDKLEFTGSPGTARHILRAAADSLTPVVLELGGKDPMIVAADADIDRAARTATAAAFMNAGQTCMSTERAIVTAPVYDRFVATAVEITGGLPTSGSDARLGPLTRPQHAEVLERRLREAEAGGAKVLVGGHAKRSAGGAVWFEPTVVTEVTPAMELYREESFGPILSILRAADVDEAIAMANDTSYGLTASVFAQDRQLARSIADRIDAGGVNINDAMLGAAMAAVPFGGVKSSGFGRLQGEQGFRDMSVTKSVTEDRVRAMPSLMATMFHRRRPPTSVLDRMTRMLYGRRR